jgi:large subunit ribosomal protein L1
MKFRSKRYQELRKAINPTTIYSVADASKLALESANTKFPSSIDIVIKLNLDTTKAEQQLRGNLALPHYFGKTTKVLILDDNLMAADAQAAGIDFFGGDDQIAKIKEG